MTRLSFLKKHFFQILFQVIVIVTLFFSAGCNCKKQPLLSADLTAEEKADLEYFFRLLIFENYGAFVLFGSKPLCQMHLSNNECTEAETAFQKWFSSLPDNKREDVEAAFNKAHNKGHAATELEHNPYRGWLALEKIKDKLKTKNFIFRLLPVHFPNSDELNPGNYELVLINIQQTALVLAKYYEIFKAASGMDFHPLQIVFEAQNPDSLFWKNVFSMKNHLAKGLLFGFGLENSTFFHWRLLFSNAQHTLESSNYIEEILEYLQSHHFELSTASVGFHQGSLSNFTIPVFRTIDEDVTVEKYKQEKVTIEKTYQGQDTVEVTLQRLASL